MDENKNENNTQKFKAIPVTGSTKQQRLNLVLEKA